MGKKGGRPRREDGERGTRQIRVFEDLADMIADLSLVLKFDTAVYVDPFLRPDVERKCETYKEQIAKAKAAKKLAEDALEKIQQEAATITSRAEKPRKPRAES